MSIVFPVKAEIHNILIQQGQPFSLAVKLKDKDTGVPIALTPYEFRSQIRKSSGLTSTLIATAACIVTPQDPTIVTIKYLNTELIPSNCQPEQIPRNFQSLQRDKLPKGLFYWSLRAFVNNAPAGRAIEGAVIITPEVTARSL